MSTNQLKIDTRLIENCFYKSNISLLFEKEEIPLNLNNIGMVGIQYDYLNNFFPILHLKIYLTKGNLLKIKKESDSVRVRFSLNCYSQLVKDGENLSTKQGIFKDMTTKVIFDKIFQPFNLNNTETTNLTPIGSKINIFENETLNDPVNTQELELYLFELDSLNNNKTIINAILSNCRIIDAIGYALTKTTINSALISQPDNLSDYSDNNEIILPPLNFKNTIQKLQDIYGIYKNGLIQFYDFDYYYLLDRNFNKTLPVANNEYENVFINLIAKEDLDVTNRIGYYKDNTNKCYIINALDNSIINNEEEFNKELSGNTINVLSDKTARESVIYDKENDKFIINKPYKTYHTKNLANGDYKFNKDSNSIIYNSIENDYIESNTINNIIESGITVTITFNNIDISYLSLNRKYILNFSNKNKSEYNGIYRLELKYFSINQTSSSNVCVFKKINNN